MPALTSKPFKLYSLVIKTFDETEGKVLCQLLSLMKSTERSTGENIFTLLDDELQTHNISWDYVSVCPQTMPLSCLGIIKGVAA